MVGIKANHFFNSKTQEKLNKVSKVQVCPAINRIDNDATTAQ
jgi:hypothetical protein